MHYQPPTQTKSRAHGVLICQPLGHEYSRSHRNLQQFSVQLAQQGFDVFRFDYSGTGNSSGVSESAVTADYIADIQAAASQLRAQSQCKELSIISLRMGAPLALSAAIDGVSHHILWDPVIKGSHYIQMLEKFHDAALTKLERFRLKRQSTNSNQLYGYAMSQAQRDSLLGLSMSMDNGASESKAHTTKPVLITSSGYEQDEPNCSALLEHYKHLPTHDDIRWHDRLFAESAFSSPEAYQVMLKVLKEDSE
jgi:alpha-beta hydrolase superfamily lysophospholipase